MIEMIFSMFAITLYTTTASSTVLLIDFCLTGQWPVLLELFRVRPYTPKVNFWKLTEEFFFID